MARRRIKKAPDQVEEAEEFDNPTVSDTEPPNPSAARIEFVEVDSVVPADLNPKAHDVSSIIASLQRFGFVEPPVLNEKTGKLVAGHGRIEALRTMQDRGMDPPERIRVSDDGVWSVPVIRGLSFASDKEAAAYLLASNRLTEKGGWVDELLAEALSVLDTDELLAGVGFTSSDVAKLLSDMEKRLDDGDGADDGSKADDLGTYVQKIEPPVYQPLGDRPPVASLADTDVYQRLCAEIDRANIPSDVAGFLKLAATRHVGFRFSRIAEYYAHASESVQDLIERSGLVVIDYEKAVELGFAKMTERLRMLTTPEDDSDD